jgi:MATE family multidrug resistance protein
MNKISEAKTLLQLALPLVIGQLAQTGISVADTIMAGGFSKVDLAGVALGSAVWLPVFLFMSGVLLALTPYIAQRVGRKDSDQTCAGLMQGLWLALVLAVLSASILWSASLWLPLFDLEQSVADVAIGYLNVLGYGVFPALLFQVIRFFHEGHGFTRMTMIMSIIAFLVNIPLNLMFVYGLDPIPAMGGVGCGVATSISYLVMALGGWWFYFRYPAYQRYRTHWEWLKPAISVMVALLRVGVPIAAAILFEVGLFTFIAFLVTPLGTDVLAAHQVAIGYTSLIFMLPLSLAMALTIRVGQLHGANDVEQLIMAIKVAYVISVTLGVMIAGFTLIFSGYIVAAYTSDSQVIQIAKGLLVFVALYQISDAIQVISAGALRGIGDTAAVMWVTFVAYWLVGLPAGYFLCYGDITTRSVWLGISGFWLSFVIGLTIAAIGLIIRVRQRFFS